MDYSRGGVLERGGDVKEEGLSGSDSEVGPPTPPTTPNKTAMRVPAQTYYPPGTQPGGEVLASGGDIRLDDYPLEPVENSELDQYLHQCPHPQPPQTWDYQEDFVQPQELARFPDSSKYCQPSTSAFQTYSGFYPQPGYSTQRGPEWWTSYV